MLKVFKNIKNEDYKNYDNDLNNIYNYIIAFIVKYYPLYNILINKFKLIIFEELNEEDKIKLIRELVAMLKCNGTNANLKFLNLKFDDRVGRLNGKNINQGTLIFQSATGIRETHYKIENDN